MVNLNDRVRVREHIQGVTLTGGRRAVEPDVDYVVSRLGTKKVMIRRFGNSMWVPLASLMGVDGQALPAPRQLGEIPTEGEHIAIDDPRVAWMWQDAAKAADQAGYCSTYDDLAEKIGAPGRPREFQITAQVHGLEATFTIKSTTKKLAADALLEKIADAKITANRDTGRRR